ncbi:MAG: chain length-determining protein [Thiobacillus sp.]|uniref:XrtA system polysaccharide chain length determinant n=1 Tax=unclassified Thiobacillus TaxID=2646513 RepID=UPI00086D28FD|nr:MULTISPECIES: XrtA system polysaccharide chain length determinant [unclassified Thiobacillus]MBN8770135.1 chain length-determining protein [Thiobacillus sp.]MBN8779502.1 chain length-determining protein [Thiobacillus sp.]ODV03807.1 MAG: chain length-determining protein [Thiobacillus sp. SCN 63-57]OJY56330.1 MAG: chain length-determining protein [Thiobacillus sp. 0-1251]QLQ03005.1 MAG: chain length-determining protein [Thiobacillus sp.]
MDQLLQQLFGYAKAAWYRRWWGVAIAWLVCVVGWTWVMMIPDRYQASARVYVDTQTLLKPLLSGLAAEPNVEQQIKLMTRQLVSRPTLEKVARMTDLDVKAKTSEQTERMLNDLASKISIADAGRENLYTISYQDANGELAKKVVQSLLTIFVESSLGKTRQDISSSQRFIEEQLQQYQQKLTDAENALKEFKQKHIGMMPGQGGDYYAKLAEVSTQLRQAQLDQQEAINRRDQLKRQLSDEEPELTAAAAAGATNSEIDDRIQALQKQMDQMRLQYTDLHPDVQATKRLIEKLEAEKKADLAKHKADPSGSKIQNPVYQQLTLSIAEADANVSSLRARVAEYQRRYAELRNASNMIPQVEQEYTQLMRDYDVYRQNYDALLKRRESVTMSGEVESKTDTVDFRVIDPPFVPSQPAWPNRPLLLSLVTLGGLGAGIAVAFLLSQLRRTVTDRRVLRELTGLPLLGAVSRVETDETRRRKRKGLLTYLAALGSLIAAYGAVMVLQLLVSRAG